MNDPQKSSGEQSGNPNRRVGSPDDMADSRRAVFRWDDGLKADAERCAKLRGESLSEFLRQATIHYIGWCAGQKAAQDDESPQR